jgi:hypothetical protein
MTQSLAKTLRLRGLLVQRPLIPAIVVSLLLMAAYLALAAAGSQAGFPLDDGWIHQTYARNLAQTGRWEYVPGAVSAGSTAPLWTLLLAAGYLLRLPHFWWAFLLGWLCLAWLAWSVMRVWQMWWPERSQQRWVAGLTLAASWSLIWAAGSGMETLLFVALGWRLLVLFFKPVAASWRPVAGAGFVAGLLVLVRPDGLVLLSLVALAYMLLPGGLAERVTRLMVFLAAAGLPLLPYFALNLWHSGSLWPNTFYAKQAEYAILWQRPFLSRLSQLLYFSLGGAGAGLSGISGAHLLLLPGVIVAGWWAARRDWHGRRLHYLLPLLWAGGHIFLYAWRLPVTYQHGRYLWAALPAWIMFGLAGWGQLSTLITGRWLKTDRLAFLWRTVTGLTFAVMLLVFSLLGAQVYAQDVAFINHEMVNVAQWVTANTPPESLVAAHDIGALGYFSERPILDLAGLISPEVIPLLSDEAALVKYIRNSDAEYLVTAPGWPYDELTSMPGVALVYDTGYAWTREQGLNNMAVYHIDRR